MEGRERLGEGLLDEVLGIGGVAGGAQCRRIQLIQQWQGLALEAGPTLLRGLLREIDGGVGLGLGIIEGDRGVLDLLGGLDGFGRGGSAHRAPP